MTLNPGDHVCTIYSTTAELAATVAPFLAEGLRLHHRCWYVASGDETAAVDAALRKTGVDLETATARGALRLIDAKDAYTIRGDFNPEATMQVFNDAVEQAYTDGFAGFRAAAEMSWALASADGVHRLIAYEALLKTLFASCRATGLCLYHRDRMPLAVINGALATHPHVGTNGGHHKNPFYDPAIDALTAVDDTEVRDKLTRLRNLPVG